MRHEAWLDDLGRTWSIAVPETRMERARGLRRARPPLPMQGMLFTRCRSVHTFGMRFAIEVVFLDAGGNVLSVRAAPPGRLLFHVRASGVLECAGGSQLKTGYRLRNGEAPDAQALGS